MSARPLHRSIRRPLLAALSVAAALALAACGGIGTKLQPPTASIQQLVVRPDGDWDAIVRFQNLSYDAGMHVYSIDATLSLAGKPAGHVRFRPALDIPAMDADIGSVTIKPDTAGTTALKATKGKAIAYELQGTLAVGKGNKGEAQVFPLAGKGYLSPVPGIANTWR